MSVLGLLDNIDQLAPKRVGIEEFTESDDYAGIALYPRQLVLLKLIFLEEMTGAEEDVLTEWINGGRNGSEITISPNIRERRDYLRSHGYPHFREIQMAVGRRASKGFTTGTSMAYKFWTTLQLGNPGEYYGIDRKKEIYFSCIAGSESQAKKFQYADMVARIESNKAFQPYIADSLETEIRIMTPADIREISSAKARGQTFKKDQARLRGNALAANAGTLRGSATMAQPLDAKILTPYGWTTMGEIQIGDEIIGSDGKSQHVTHIHPRGIQPTYRVTMSDGSSTTCGPDHLWTLYQPRKTHIGKTKTILEFANDLTKKAGGNKPDYYKWALPQAPVIQYDTQKLPLDPYLLGALLGDGSFSGRSGVAFYNLDNDIVEEVRKALPDGHELIQNPNELIQFRIVKSNKKTGPTHLNQVRNAIHQLGLSKHSGQYKFIPEQYLRGSFDERLSILQGLLDTDGTISKDSAIKLGTTSYQLALDTVELVRSLGGYATIHSRPISPNISYVEDKVIRSPLPIYEICISDLRQYPLFRCQRKLLRQKPYAFYSRRRRALVNVEYIGEAVQQCITVSNVNGLYVTDDMIITHNCVTIDEAAHMIAGESKSSAGEVYNAAGPSLDQFGTDGLLFINSSPYSKVGMFHDLYELGLMPFDQTRPVDLMTIELQGDDSDLADQRINGDPRRLVFQGPSWALFEGYRYYKSQYKPRTRGKMLGKMVTVSPDWNPDEVDEQDRPLFSQEDKAAIIQARASEAADPETYKVERRGKFAEISEAWLNPSMVDRMYNGRPIGLVRQPNGDMVLGYEPFSTNYGVGINTGFHRYKFHLDPSSTTAGFGFAIGHIEYLPDPVTGLDNEHCVFDLIKRWNPSKQPNKVIRWAPIIDEIITYAKIFHPFEITMDQHQCLNENTLIPTIGGNKTLKELAGELPVGKTKTINIPVQTMEGIVTATEIYNRGHVPTRILTTKPGYSIEGTTDHRLWVRKNKIKPWHKSNKWEWLEIAEIEKGDYVAVRKNNVTATNYVDIKKYHPTGSGSSKYVGVSYNPETKQHWVANVSKNNHQITIGRFDTEKLAYNAVLDWKRQHSRRKGCLYPTQLNEDIGFILGALTAEGYVNESNICFSNSDKTYLDMYKDAAERTFGGDWSYRYELKHNTTPQGGQIDTMYGSIAASGYISKMFTQLGCFGDSYIKEVPWAIFQSPESVIVNFLKAYFEGDGWAVNSRHNDEIVGCSTRSAALAKGIQQLLLNLGIYSTIWNGAASTYKGTPQQEWRVKMFGLDILEFHKKIGFCSDRKNHKLSAIVDQISRRKDVGKRSKLNREGDLQYFRIDSIVESTANCFDLVVPGPELFVANGIISHNSSSPLQDIQDRLHKENITCQVYVRPTTAELNWKKCEVFKTALYQGLVHAPNDEEIDSYTSKEELKFLQQVQTSGKFPRVDKQDLGPVQTKDMADAVIDVVWALLGNLQIQTMRERLSQASVVGGAPGGYGMGQNNYPNGAPMPMNTDGSYYYSQGNIERSRAERSGGNPARGSIGMRRNGGGNRINSRGRR
jgi:intein/homing endonuclease